MSWRRWRPYQLAARPPHQPPRRGQQLARPPPLLSRQLPQQLSSAIEQRLGVQVKQGKTAWQCRSGGSKALAGGKSGATKAGEEECIAGCGVD